MKEILLIIILCLFIVILLRRENFSSIPNIPLGLQWGSTPHNLYKINDDDSNNYFSSSLSTALAVAELRDNKLGRGQGYGMSDINAYLGSKHYGYSVDKVYYT
jgi:hypothetical protein